MDTLISAMERFGLVHHPMYRSYIDLELGMFYMLRVDLDLEPKGQGQGLRITVHSKLVSVVLICKWLLSINQSINVPLIWRLSVVDTTLKAPPH